MISLDQVRPAIIGLGYVGLPLAVEFGKRRPTIGYDIDPQRIEALIAGRDVTLEVSTEEIDAATQLAFTADLPDLAECNVYIVTVPTPIDKYKRPDLRPLMSATEAVATVLRAGDIVVYESTVFPGATEQECVPLLERVSGLRFNHDFYVGYSPERINPGDRGHRLPDIRKVTSGSTTEAATLIDGLYAEIITAGTYKAESIAVAEAAKVIENTQRDLNIALINELAIIFDRLGLDTEAVLEAASTKWNFLNFKPGLVGGHCIGVDPYYLTFRAEASGYRPEIILAGRRLNDGMGTYVAGRFVKELVRRGAQIKGARVLIMGLTFKEDCPDTRNTRVVDVIEELKDYGAEVDVCDPWVDPGHAPGGCTFRAMADLETRIYDGVIVAVAHKVFREEGVQIIDRVARDDALIFDLKNVLPRGFSTIRL